MEREIYGENFNTYYLTLSDVLHITSLPDLY